MCEFFSKLFTKIGAVITAVILTFSPAENLEFLIGEEPSTLLTQTEVVFGELAKEKELSRFYEKGLEDFVVPGLYEMFIPQGICYDEENEVFLISGYYKDKALPSRIIVVDKDGNFIKSVGAVSKKGNYAYGHFGGIAVYKNWVYISTTGCTHVLLLSDILSAENDSYCTIQTALYTDVTCSFANVCDGVLYIGEYTADSLKEKREATNVYKGGKEKFYSRCNAFILDSASPYGIKDGMIDSDGNITPDFAFGIPLKAQGFAVLSDGRILVSASAGGRKNASLYVYKDVTKLTPNETITVNDKEVPLYLLLKENLIEEIKAPTYLEDIAVAGENTIYLITESAAAPYIEKSRNPIDNVIKFDMSGIN